MWQYTFLTGVYLLHNLPADVKRITQKMGKEKKKTKKPKDASRSASASDVPEEMDEENRTDSSPERRRKLPSIPVFAETQHREKDTEGDPLEVTAAKKTEQYIVYVKGINEDIIAVARKHEVKFARAIDNTVGQIIMMKFRNNCLSISCETEEQRQKLLDCKELL